MRRKRNTPAHYRPSPQMTRALALVSAGATVREAAASAGLTFQAVAYRMDSDPARDARTLARESAAGVGRSPSSPTQAPVGSDARLAAFAERAARGESLFHDADSRELDGGAPDVVMDHQAIGRTARPVRMSR